MGFDCLHGNDDAVGFVLHLWGRGSTLWKSRPDWLCFPGGEEVMSISMATNDLITLRNSCQRRRWHFETEDGRDGKNNAVQPQEQIFIISTVKSVMN